MWPMGFLNHFTITSFSRRCRQLMSRWLYCCSCGDLQASRLCQTLFSRLQQQSQKNRSSLLLLHTVMTLHEHCPCTVTTAEVHILLAHITRPDPEDWCITGCLLHAACLCSRHGAFDNRQALTLNTPLFNDETPAELRPPFFLDAHMRHKVINYK